MHSLGGKHSRHWVMQNWGVAIMHRKVSHRLLFAWAHPLVCQRACSQLWQHETSSFLHSMSDSSTNCKNAQRKFKNKRSRAIGMAWVAHGKSRTRLCIRIRQMNPPEEGRGALFGRRAMRQTERTFKNKQSRAIGQAWVAHGKLRRRHCKKVQANESLWNWQRRAVQGTERKTAARRIWVTLGFV